MWVLLAQSQIPPDVPTGVVGGGFAAAVVGLLGWFIKRQVASTEKAVESLGKAVDVLSSVDARQRKLVKAFRRDLMESRRAMAEEHEQVAKRLADIDASLAAINASVSELQVKGVHLRSEKTVVVTPSNPS